MHHWTVWLWLQDELSKPLLVCQLLQALNQWQWRLAGLSVVCPVACPVHLESLHPAKIHWMAAQPSAVSATSPCFVSSANLLRLLSVPPPRPLTQLHPNTGWALGYVTCDSSQVKGTHKDLGLEGFNFCWSIYRDVWRVLLKVYGKMYFIGDRLISVRIYFEMPIILKYLLLSKTWNII